MSKDEPEFDLSIKEVCEREGVSRQTVHNWLADGLPSRLEAVKGRQQERRIDVTHLDGWLIAQRSKQQQQAEKGGGRE